MNLHDFYTQRKEAFTARFNRHRALLRRSSLLRLVLFIATAAAVYFLSRDWRLALLVGVLGFALFMFLVSRHTNLKRKRDFLAAMIGIQEEEIRINGRDFLHREDGSRYRNDLHEYSLDIDLYGAGSLFQYMNRCVTAGGGMTLSRKLNNHISIAPQDIKNRQEALRELAQKVDFRQEFQATASLLDAEQDPVRTLEWMKDYKAFVPQVFAWLPYVVFGINLVLGVLYYFDVINGYIMAAGFFLGLGITGRYVKKITAFSAYTGKLEKFFAQYSALILAIEREDFTATHLVGLRDDIKTETIAASGSMRELAGHIARLDQRNNMLFGVLANGFGLWDLFQVRKIEQWLEVNSTQVEKWMQVVAEVEALNTLANFVFNHDTYTFPMIEDGAFKLRASAAVHPLLDPEKAIGNDIAISAGEFFIITGANMAGKSTFLRTVATKIIMANMGLPVCAQRMVYSPIRLITSMRTTDSLTDDASYFFSELKRLKYIVDKIRDEPYFIVLDEILKGTNSQDKAQGSRRLIEKLSKNRATGIIATHDLSLTEVAREYDNISNYYFDADITDDVLTFDYTFKAGVATNMNASFLLRKMGIVDE